MTAWQNVGTILYRIPEPQPTSTVHLVNLLDIIIPITGSPTQSPAKADFETNEVASKYKWYPVSQLFVDLPVTQCLIENSGNVASCRHLLDVKKWVWKSDPTPAKLRSLAGAVLIYFTAPSIFVLPQTYSLCNLLGQVIDDLKFRPYVFVSTGMDPVQKILEVFQSVTQIRAAIERVEIPPQPAPTFDDEPELIVTVGTATSGYGMFGFPPRYVRLTAPVPFPVGYPRGTSFVIVGTNLTYGERAVYIKYAVNLGISARIFWFAVGSLSDSVEVPTESTDGVPVVRVN